MQAAFCSWYSTGGEIDGLLTQLPLADLNATGDYQAGSAGVMFEKVSPHYHLSVIGVYTVSDDGTVQHDRP
jgi:hypothetical protein